MDTPELIGLIDAYFSGKTSTAEEQFLFSRLSGDEGGRGYFKDSLLLKTAFQSAEETFPAHLEESITREIGARENKTVLREFTRPALIPLYTAALCVLIFSFLFYSRMESYRTEVDKAMIMIKNQQNTIELLMNGLPTVQVTPATSRSFSTTNN